MSLVATEIPKLFSVALPLIIVATIEVMSPTKPIMSAMFEISTVADEGANKVADWIGDSDSRKATAS